MRRIDVALLALAVAGELVPGGLFLSYLAHDYTSLSAALQDRAAVAFFADLAMSTFVLGWLFAKRPLGPVKWYWFVILSFAGTLAFSIPFYLWLNWRKAPGHPAFHDWWRSV